MSNTPPIVWECRPAVGYSTGLTRVVPGGILHVHSALQTGAYLYTAVALFFAIGYPPNANGVRTWYVHDDMIRIRSQVMTDITTNTTVDVFLLRFLCRIHIPGTSYTGTLCRRLPLRVCQEACMYSRLLARPSNGATSLLRYVRTTPTCIFRVYSHDLLKHVLYLQ